MSPSSPELVPELLNARVTPGHSGENHMDLDIDQRSVRGPSRHDDSSNSGVRPGAVDLDPRHMRNSTLPTCGQLRCLYHGPLFLVQTLAACRFR
jgi:hypothetical protein